MLNRARGFSDDGSGKEQHSGPTRPAIDARSPVSKQTGMRGIHRGFSGQPTTGIDPIANERVTVEEYNKRNAERTGQTYNPPAQQPTGSLLPPTSKFQQRLNQKPVTWKERQEKLAENERKSQLRRMDPASKDELDKQSAATQSALPGPLGKVVASANESAIMKTAWSRKGYEAAIQAKIKAGNPAAYATLQANKADAAKSADSQWGAVNDAGQGFGAQPQQFADTPIGRKRKALAGG